MSNTDRLSVIIQILEPPKQKKALCTEVRAQFPNVRKKGKDSHIVILKFLGNLSLDVTTYYKLNDYVLIEGYPVIKSNSWDFSSKMEIIVFKIYPFLLSSN